MQLERDVIEQARNGALRGPRRLFVACDADLAAKRATANRERTVAFDEERLAIVRDRLGDVLLSTITRETIEGFQTKPAKMWDGAWRSLRGAAGLASGSMTWATRSSRTCSRLVSPSTLSKP